MAVVIDCPSCQRKLRLPAKKLGQPLKCPACSHLFTPPAGPVPTTPEAVFAALTNPPAPNVSEPTPEPPPEATTAPSPPPSPSPEVSPADANGKAPPAAPPPEEMTLQPVYDEPSWLMDTLFFRKMITPLFIQFLFWGGVVLSVLGGASGIVFGLFGYSQVELKPVMVGLFLILLGPILIRVVCELLLIVFFIYDTLLEIKRNTSPAEKPSEKPAKEAE